MNSSNFTFQDELGEVIYCYRWEPESEPKAIVQFVHGMAEHAARYAEIAKAFTAEGFLCIAEDHHGHGKTVSSESELGTVPGTWKDIAEDIHTLSVKIKEEFPDLPFFYIGHSWGSMLGQYYIQQWGDEIDGCVLSGTSGNQPALGISVFLAKMISFFRGKDKPAKLMDKMAFGAFNKPFEPSRTDFDWLSRDEREVDKYVKDPYCGFVCSNGFYLQMMELLRHIWKTEHEHRIPKDLPIFLIAGEKDPVSDNTNTISQLIDRYKSYGIEDLDQKFYSGARHEVFNETNRDEVYQDVINWVKNHIE